MLACEICLTTSLRQGCSERPGLGVLALNADVRRPGIPMVLASPVLHADETSIRINGKNYWLHSCSASDLTLSFCHPKRGRAAMDDIGIIPPLWRNLGSRPLGKLSLLRRLRPRVLRLASAARPPVRHRLQRPFLGQKHEEAPEGDRPQGPREPGKCLAEPELKAMRKRYRTILTKGQQELPKPPPRIKGKRGRVAKSDAENLHEAFVRHETEILWFARRPAVPFTNNRNERDIRMAKVKQKISGCFRSPKYAAAWCRISSYLKSMGYKGYNPLTAIQLALMGKAAETV